MDFARKQLEKYGWKDGQGLGRNENGISAPIKPKLKFDNAGLGHDPGAQFTNKWWETLFNDASQNIDVQVLDESINFALKSQPVEYGLKKKDKNALYGSFLKTSKLTNKGVERYDVPTVKEIPKKCSELTDEELFAACGGRTAHKGARHGLQLSGKLSRIEKQEKMLIKKMKGTAIEDEDKIIKKMKKLQLQKDKIDTEDNLDSVEPVSDSSCSSIKKKKKKSKKSVSFNETVLEYHIIPTLEDNNGNALPDPLVGDNQDVNSDEGIEQDLEENNNNQEDDNHRSFEQPQFVISDLSNAERKKLKKKRKIDGKFRATARFIQAVQEGVEEFKEKGDGKKRKLNNLEAKNSEVRRYNSDIGSPERRKKKLGKMGEMKPRRKERDSKREMRNIVMSMDNFCKISGDD